MQKLSKQKLSARLQAAADFVTCGNSAADIGTDHGFLAIYLIQSGRCPHVTAMDVRQGPLARAQEHIEDAGLSGVIQTRLSDGLSRLAHGEAESVVIAGMGGLTVIKILEAAKKGRGFADLKELILEPQSDPAKVRKFLRENDLSIDRENLVWEDGKFYPVLHVVPKAQGLSDAYAARDAKEAPDIQNEPDILDLYLALQKEIPDPIRIQKLLDQYGEWIVFHRHPLLARLLERDQKRRRAILEALGNSNGERKKAQRRKEVEQELREIGILLELTK